MQSTYIIFLTTLLFTKVFAKNSKINQYASIEDCHADVNIISHAYPYQGGCYEIDSRTQALFLVTGDGAAGTLFDPFSGEDCKDYQGGHIDRGSCVARPAGTVSIMFDGPTGLDGPGVLY